MESRELGPDMIAEGWFAYGDLLMWCHPPSHGVVTVDECQRKNVSQVPCAPGESLSDPDETVYVVWCREHDDLGNPSTMGDGFLTSSYAKAIGAARGTRKAILENRPRWQPSKQLTLDDVLERNTERSRT